MSDLSDSAEPIAAMLQSTSHERRLRSLWSENGATRTESIAKVIEPNYSDEVFLDTNNNVVEAED